MNVVFYHESEDSLVKYWFAGLKSCGNNILQQPKSNVTQLDFMPELLILENPSESDLERIPKAKQTVCIVGDNYQKFYKNYSFINLWVEPCFYDKETEKSFSTDGLPFYYCPNASQDCFVRFYTEINRPYDLSSNVLMNASREQEFKVVNVDHNDPHPEIVYGNTKVNLNYQTPKDNFVYLNQMAFDIPMSGNFELSTIPYITEVFDGKVGYTSEGEMRDKIKYYISHEEERTRMAIKAYEICIAKHTYTYRMRDLLKKLNLL